MFISRFQQRLIVFLSCCGSFDVVVVGVVSVFAVVLRAKTGVLASFSVSVTVRRPPCAGIALTTDGTNGQATNDRIATQFVTFLVKLVLMR